MPSNSREYYRQWRRKHPEHAKEYRGKHLQHIRECERNLRENLKKEIFNLLGNKCSNPDCLVPNECRDIRCLQIDHVKGGGSKELKRLRTSYRYYRYVLQQLRAGSKDYQLLCANCNWIKRFEKKEVNQHIYRPDNGAK